jgi:serine/threonine protein kinase
VRPEAVSCIECGYLLGAEASAQDEEKLNLCVNPQCKVANPPNERNCVRCNTPLPYPAGTVIHGRYRIGKFLAVGCFGAVYQAADTQADGRPVAIKEMTSSDLAEFSIRVTYWRREVEILRLLESFPIVPRVYDLIEEDHTAYLVLEWLAGKDLLLLLDRHNTPFPFEQVLEWGRAICDMLTALHEHDPPLVHRDLRPENFVLLEDQRSIKMISFDTVCAIGTTPEKRGQKNWVTFPQGYVPNEKRMEHDEVLAALGYDVPFSHGYFPIEQRAGMPEPRSDLFALAATLYHLATGKEAQGVYTARAIEAQLADPGGNNPADQRWFFELIKINLAEDVRVRSSSAREFKTYLERRQVTREMGFPERKFGNPSLKLYGMPVPAKCPVCSSLVPSSAVSCSECGFHLPDVPAPAAEATVVRCINCTTANTLAERRCARCYVALPALPGTVIDGHYRIDKVVAVGGFGPVYLAADIQEDGRPVAIKELTCDDPGEFRYRRQFFRREADILQLLQGLPIVPGIYDLIEKGERPIDRGNASYLVLEFLRGNDLWLLMETEKRPFAFEHLIEWGKAICDVLHRLHTHWPPLVHRDIGPGSFVLLEDQGAIKMISFDAVCAIDTTRREWDKSMVYYGGYPPIEQKVGMPEPGSDFFALAATLYRLATGKEFEGECTARAIEAQLADPGGNIPADQRWFFELIKINLNDDVRQRSSSALEFKADLERRQVTRERSCPKCQSDNPTRNLYCAQCGQPLDRMPCPACGKNNRPGDHPCIYCGNKLA